MRTEHLEVIGMCCTGCTGKISRALTALPGVREITATLATGRIAVQYDEHRNSLAGLIAAVERAGYRVGPCTAGRARHPKVPGGTGPQTTLFYRQPSRFVAPTVH